MSRERDSGLKTIAMILMVVVLAIIIINPQGNDVLTEGTGDAMIEYEFSDITPVITKAREQYLTGIWKDEIAYQDYSSGNWDVWVYNSTSKTNVSYATSLPHEQLPVLSDVAVVWIDGRDDPFSYSHVYGKWRSNLTEWTIYPDAQHSYPQIYDDVVLFGSDMDIEGLFLYNVTSNVTHEIADGVIDYPIAWDIWENKVVACNRNSPTSYTFYYHDNATDSLTALDSTTSSAIQTAIYEDDIVYIILEGGEYVLKHYDTTTGQTTLLSTALYQYMYGLDIYGDWVIYGKRGNASQTSLYAYNLVEEEEYLVYDELNVRRSKIWGNKIFIGAEDMMGGDTEDDVGLIEITAVEVPSTPSTPSQRAESFVSNNWIFIVIVLAVVIALIGVEGYYYDWEHFKAINEKVNVGLIISLVIIGVIIVFWIIFYS